MVSLHRHHGLAPLSLGPGHFWLALVGHFSFAPKNAGTTPEDHSDFATNDAMALGVIRAVQEAGLRLPDDLSLVGFDDIDVAAIVNPPLTTIWAPKYEMGEACAEVLMKIAGKADALPERRFFR